MNEEDKDRLRRIENKVDHLLARGGTGFIEFIMFLVLIGFLIDRFWFK